MFQFIFRNKKLTSVALTVLLILAIPLTLFLLNRSQDIRQHASGLECVETILPPNGTAGTNPMTRQLFSPSAAVMNGNHIYVFLIGEGEIANKPFGDWYNLFVIDGIVRGDGKIDWTDHNGTIFRNIRGILSSAVRTYVDGDGIHVYVEGYNYQTRAPEGEYSVLIHPDDSIGDWTGFDGMEGSASENTDVSAGGRQFRFSTVGGPLSGCRLEQQGGPVGRGNTPDRADEVSGKQFKIIYMIPSDGEDRKFDLNGTISTSIAAAQNWLAARSGQYQLLFDTYNGGQLDIGFIKASKTDNEMTGFQSSSDWMEEWPYINNRIMRELQNNGYDVSRNSQKKFLVYYDGNSHYMCGDGGPDNVAALYLRGRDRTCITDQFSSSPTNAQYGDISALHEMFHVLGAVDGNAPHEDGSHIKIPDNTETASDIEEDLMYSSGNTGADTHRNRIDMGNDDYFNITNTSLGLSDVAKSGYLVRGNAFLCTPFLDICDYNQETQKAISCLSSQYGVVKGLTPERFDGEGYIARGTYVAFLVRYYVNVLKDQSWVDDMNSIESYYDNLPSSDSGAPFGQKKFNDVDKSYSLWKEIYLSQKRGFILGYSDGGFKPNTKWFYGFHGITRTDNFRGSPYDFINPSSQDQNGITRATFITNLYQYSLDNYRSNLNQCAL